MNHKKILNDVKTLLGLEVKLEQLKLDNGTIVEAEAFEVNAEIFIISEEEKVALPIGEYTLEDGRQLSILEDGIIAEIKEAGEEAPVAEEEVAPELEKESTAPKKIIESISKEMFFEEIKKLNDKIDGLQLSKVEEVKEEVKEIELSEDVKPIIPSPESKVDKKIVNLYSQKKSRTAQDVAFEMINKFKNKNK